MSSEDLEAGTRVPAPAWIVASLEVNEGRDPLGLQTTTQDRLMPVLLPGILELSRRARYFSFHAFLLAEYQARRFQPDSKSLSAFIKHREWEWEFGLAVQRCPRGCGSSPVGTRKLGSVSLGSGPFPRGESVESAFGGYGLYYRSPMAELGIVARSGTLLGDQPIPIDVLYDTDRARRLAATFKAAVEGTVYYQRAMWTNDDLPAHVIDEYAEVACLCQLRERPEERDAVHDALFGIDPAESRPTATVTGGEDAPIQDDQAPVAGFSEAGVVQRRRSVGHYLTLVDADAGVVDSEGIYRELLWSPPTPRSDGHALVGGQWAALIAKDVWQEALCSVWSEFCRSGLAHSRDLGRGLTWDETREVAASLVAGPPDLDAATPTAELASRLAPGTLTIPDAAGADVNVAAVPLESLRRLTDEVDTAASGLVVLLELARCRTARVPAGSRRPTSPRRGSRQSPPSLPACAPISPTRRPSLTRCGGYCHGSSFRSTNGSGTPSCRSSPSGSDGRTVCFASMIRASAGSRWPRSATSRWRRSPGTSACGTTPTRPARQRSPSGASGSSARHSHDRPRR
jgi:hypothetical protein